MALTTASVSPRRAPNGVVSDKPIAVRLKPDEIERVRAAADREQRSLAAVCRLAVLRGLDDYDQDPLALTRPA